MELLTTSWPFDSDPNVTYDDLGFPILDRAVGADTLQRAFAQYFSNGVFRTPSNPFRISKGSGLSVSISPGMCVINGGMAGWWDEARTVTLEVSAPQWLTHYAVFLRYDNNDDMRGIYLRVDASAAGADVPAPVSGANVEELRLGYITVPANATDLSGATITNEVGTSMAPFAMPLFDVDVTVVLEDLKAKAEEAYRMYYDLLISSVDETTAGLLQAQISENKSRINALEENQFTQESIDAQALRAEMGLGNTTGVLGVPYGGTGVTSDSELYEKINSGIHKTITLFNKVGAIATDYYAKGTIEPGYYLAYAKFTNKSTAATNNSAYWIQVSFDLYINSSRILYKAGNEYIGNGNKYEQFALFLVPEAVTLGELTDNRAHFRADCAAGTVSHLSVDVRLIKIIDF